MRKTVAALTGLLCFSAVGLVNAEATQGPSGSDGASLAGEIFAVVGIVVVFAVIGYAGYRLIKKWSSSSSSD